MDKIPKWVGWILISPVTILIIAFMGVVVHAIVQTPEIGLAVLLMLVPTVLIVTLWFLGLAILKRKYR